MPLILHVPVAVPSTVSTKNNARASGEILDKSVGSRMARQTSADPLSSCAVYLSISKPIVPTIIVLCVK